jgi:hypothetical protein
VAAIFPRVFYLLVSDYYPTLACATLNYHRLPAIAEHTKDSWPVQGCHVHVQPGQVLSDALCPEFVFTPSPGHETVVFVNPLKNPGKPLFNHKNAKEREKFHTKVYSLASDEICKRFTEWGSCKEYVSGFLSFIPTIL